MSGGYRAVVFGGSGNVGKQLVATLFANAPETYAKITLISRRPLPEYDDIEKYKGVISVRVVPDMNAVGSEDLSGHDAAFMLLGAGQPSKVDKDELMRIDCTLPVAFADACKKGGVQHFSALSAYGVSSAHSYSAITKTTAAGGWYSHVKGTMEEEIEKKGFNSLSLFRPAMIYPGNENSPASLGWLNQKLNWLLPNAFNTASSTDIAQGMDTTMRKQLNGTVTGKVVIDGGRAVVESATSAEK